MNLDTISLNVVNADGVPTGGHASGPGYEIHWQEGPLLRPGEDGEPIENRNGAFVQEVIAAVKQRLEFFQTSSFACHENAAAIEFLAGALIALDLRTRSREARQVAGTHKP